MRYAINCINKIIMNYNLKRLGISIDALKEAKKIRGALEKNNAM